MAKENKLTGMLVANAWDYETSNLIQLAIETDDYETYIVRNDKLLKELKDYVDQKIELIGRVWEDKIGDKYINVSDFTVMN